MRRPFLLGVITTIAVGALVALLGAVIVIATGTVDIAATVENKLADRVLGYASTRAIAHHATQQANPLANDAAAQKKGLADYRKLCAPCHGGPGVDSAEFAAGLHPMAPDLSSPDIQSFTDGMLYETISRGIGSTGMPAFIGGRDPNDIWALVTAVRHLNELKSAAATPAVAATPADGGTTATKDDEHTHRVRITGFKFDPPTVEVKAGDAVVWTNEDFVAHTATADDKSFDTGKLDSGQSKHVVMPKAGTFSYFCRYHLAMKGSVAVK